VGYLVSVGAVVFFCTPKLVLRSVQLLTTGATLNRFPLRGSATSALIRPCCPRINTLAAAMIDSSYLKEKEKKEREKRKYVINA
jgi:hypothetical protein